MNAARNVPPIVPIVLSKLAHLRTSQCLPEEEFQQKINRLSKEELERIGMSLLVRDLSNGRTRFIIKDCMTQSTIHMQECD